MKRSALIPVLVLSLLLLVIAEACGTAPKKCDAKTCDGCCDEIGECLSGAELSACGTGGVACVSCAANLKCAAGACEPFADGEYDASFGDDPDANYNRDAGLFDAGPPPVDAGRVDAGVDAGRADAGRADSGVDAGRPDAGIDAGRPDAGLDAGVDAGVDAGSIADASVDAGDGG